MRLCRGSILVLVLFVLFVLSMITAGLAYRAGLETRSVRNRGLTEQLKASAESAVAIAIARLAQNTNDFDHPAEPWSLHGPLALENWMPEWAVNESSAAPQILVDYRVIDEEGKLHVAYASAESLQKLGMTPEQIAGLFDWMDEDGIAQPHGAESDYYLTLSRPYLSKNAAIEILEELLLIRGFGRLDYYGGAWPALFLPIGDESVRGIAESGNGYFGWINLLTCVGNGKININTAPLPVLQTLPLSAGTADQIVRFREMGSTSSGELEDHVFQSEADIDQLQGITAADRTVLKGIAVFRSHHFRIIAEAHNGSKGRTYRVQALVRMKDNSPQIIQWVAG